MASPVTTTSLCSSQRSREHAAPLVESIAHRVSLASDFSSISLEPPQSCTSQLDRETVEALQAFLSELSVAPDALSPLQRMLGCFMDNRVITQQSQIQSRVQQALGRLLELGDSRKLKEILSLIAPRKSDASSVLTALQTLVSSSSPSGLTQSLAFLIASAARSETARRGAVFCYEKCSPFCERPCGCGEGEKGCGQVGRFFCQLWGSTCGVNLRHRERLEASLQALEAQFGIPVLLLALNHSGADVVSILCGKESDLPTPEALKEACEKMAQDLPLILQNATQARWTKAFERCYRIIENEFWRHCLLAGLASESSLDTQRLEERVRVLTTTAGGITFVSNFSMKKLIGSLASIKISLGSVSGPMGIILAAGVMLKIGSVLTSAVMKGHYIWIDVDTMMDMVCIVLAYMDVSVSVDQSIIENALVQELFLDVQKRKLQVAYINKRVQTVTKLDNPFIDLSERAVQASIERWQQLRDPCSSVSRSLFTEMNAAWLAAIGISEEQPL